MNLPDYVREIGLETKPEGTKVTWTRTDGAKFTIGYAAAEEATALAYGYFTTVINRVEQAEKALETYQRVKAPTWDSLWDEILEFVPSSILLNPTKKILIEAEEAGDWLPYDVGDGWMKCAYAFEWGRDEAGRYICVYEVDTDGNWLDAYFYENDFEIVWNNYLSVDVYFTKWAEYYIECAKKGGIDPLGEFTKGPVTPFQCIEAAEDMLG